MQAAVASFDLGEACASGAWVRRLRFACPTGVTGGAALPILADMTPSPPRLLFVCLGNICRSPLAEAAFRAAAQRAGLQAQADSAGTGDWHIGHAPDPRAQDEARRHGIDISGYKGRQVTQADFTRFTHILALDGQNLADLQAIMPARATASMGLLLDHVAGRQGQSVADPYWSGPEAFSRTWGEVMAAAEALVAKLAAP